MPSELLSGSTYVAGSSSVIYLYINICVLSSFLGCRELAPRVYEFENRLSFVKPGAFYFFKYARMPSLRWL